MKEALNHTEQAIAINPNLGEALFQAAKVKMALGEVDAALPVLSKAIDQDRFYALKASGDEDFQRHDDKLRDYLNAIRQEKYRQAVPKVKEAFEKFRFWIENAPEVKDSIDIYKANEFMKNGENWPLMDILQVVQTLPELLSNIEQNAKSATFFRQTNTSAISVSYEEAYPVEETYQEEVVIKSGGLFRKAITELQTKSRTTMKIVQKSYSLQGIRLDILDGLGNSSNSFEFCQIPSGSFMMGDDKGNGPIHQVTISQDFYLGKFTVTQAQWETVMGNNPSKFKGANLPVEKVAWDDCQEFIRNLNATCKGAFRLPTEAEWEYACRAGSNGEYCFGDNETQLGDYAWYSANSGKQTQPVGKKRPNAWGLHDMHGNVFEWCQDWHNTYPSGRATDPQGASSGSFRVYRGGCWSRNANEAMSAHRISCAPNHRYDILGFRLVYVQNV
jgi:formylglycine-generating enzyme required for sulfatase activity